MQKDIDIRLLREKNGWTQDQLAEQLGVDRSSISRMENGGRIRGPIRKLLEKLNFGQPVAKEAAE